MGGQRHAPAVLRPERRSGIHCTGRCVDLRTSRNGCREKNISGPHGGSKPETVQPVDSDYTDYAIRSPILRTQAG
jgi:hypothetical protein